MPKKEKLLDFEFEWEGLTKCPLCSHGVMIPNGSVDWLEMQFWYVVCPKCGLKYMNPRPTQDSYQEFYKDLFWQQKVRNLGFIKHGQMWGVKQYKWDNQKKWNAKDGRKNKMEKLKSLRIETITKALNKKIKLDKNTKILEVGCGFPVTLDALHKNHGCNVYAIEPSEEAQDEIKKNKHITFLAPYGESLEKIAKKQKFDAIIFSHSLENTSIPFDIMRYTRQALKKGGVVYVQCANLQTFDQMNPYHPYIFSESAFRYLGKLLKMKYERLSDGTDRMLTSLFIK
tara:strand:+ start:7614 stop:8468 length:855 start_codon:yes stop_codon:yes gene_type:complete